MKCTQLNARTTSYDASRSVMSDSKVENMRRVGGGTDLQHADDDEVAYSTEERGDSDGDDGCVTNTESRSTSSEENSASDQDSSSESYDLAERVGSESLNGSGSGTGNDNSTTRARNWSEEQVGSHTQCIDRQGIYMNQRRIINQKSQLPACASESHH